VPAFSFKAASCETEGIIAAAGSDHALIKLNMVWEFCINNSASWQDHSQISGMAISDFQGCISRIIIKIIYGY